MSIKLILKFHRTLKRYAVKINKSQSIFHVCDLLISCFENITTVGFSF